MNETDEQLYESFLHKGNEEALLMLIKRHRGSLVLFINGFVNNMTVAEELSLDAFAEVAAGPTFFSDKSSFKTWLFSIGKNLALMQLRKTIHTEDIENVSVAGDQSPELDILKSEKNRLLNEGLSKLNEDYRRILILLYFEDMTHEQVSKVMKKSKKQVYNLVERAKKALKEELIKMGFENDFIV